MALPLAATSPLLIIFLITEWSPAVTTPPLAIVAPVEVAMAVSLPVRTNLPSASTTVSVSTPPLLFRVPLVTLVPLALAPAARFTIPSLVITLSIAFPPLSTFCVPPATWVAMALVPSITSCVSVGAMVTSMVGRVVVGLTLFWSAINCSSAWSASFNRPVLVTTSLSASVLTFSAASTAALVCSALSAASL